MTSGVGWNEDYTDAMMPGATSEWKVIGVDDTGLPAA